MVIVVAVSMMVSNLECSNSMANICLLPPKPSSSSGHQSQTLANFFSSKRGMMKVEEEVEEVEAVEAVEEEEVEEVVMAWSHVVVT